MTTYVELDGNIREQVGHGVSRKLSKKDRIPAVIYSENGSENVCIDLDIKKFEKEYFEGNVQLKIFKINTGKEVFEVIPYQIDVHPVSDRPRHISFMSVKGKKEIKVMIPLNCINKEKSPGIKKGGYLNMIKRRLQLWVDPKNIPNGITVDCGSLLLKQSIKISGVNLPEGTRPVTKKDLILVTVIGRGKNNEADVANASANATAPATDSAKK